MVNGHDKQLLEEIFGLYTKNPVTYDQGADWAYGRKNFKPFRMHYFQCKENGNLTHEKCQCCGHELLMCKKYGGQCNSGKCKKDRIREGEEKQCMLF